MTDSGDARVTMICYPSMMGFEDPGVRSISNIAVWLESDIIQGGVRQRTDGRRSLF